MQRPQINIDNKSTDRFDKIDSFILIDNSNAHLMTTVQAMWVTLVINLIHHNK